MDIVIDFDGTVVTHEFPKVGRDIGAVPVLKVFFRSPYLSFVLINRTSR